MSAIETKEVQNQFQIDDFRKLGPVLMGPWTSHIWRHDPRHIGFLLARYKFVAKMLAGRDAVMEVGCGDAVGTPVVLQTREEGSMASISSRWFSMTPLPDTSGRV